MARRRARKTYCPACDAKLDPALADDEAPRCNVCDQDLLPRRVAGIWRRSLAGTVDLGVLLITAGMLNWGLLSLSGADPLLGDARGLAAVLAILDLELGRLLRHIAPFLAMSGLYLALFWALTGRTPGGRLLRLRVVAQDGRPPSLVRSIIRVAIHLAGLGVGALGWLWTALDPQKRGWHDHLAQTYVVRES